MHDVRILQILFLGTLLAAGAWLRDFSLRPSQVALTFFAGIATQVLCARTRGLKRIGIPSAVITCLSLSILLRAETLWPHPLLSAPALVGNSLEVSRYLIRATRPLVGNRRNCSASCPGTIRSMDPASSIMRS